jgi:hypothetical protein
MVTEHLLLGTSSSVDTVQRDKTNTVFPLRIQTQDFHVACVKFSTL